jgi:LysR family transcriptional activator of dmlA
MDITDLNDIRIFAAVGQEGTLTAAAAKLQLPPSTVSRALTRLEKSLDVLLVKRSPRGLVLTDFGKEYLVVCRKALRTLREGGDTLAAHREHPSGLIKVACPITMARSIFAPLLKTFLERFPDLQVNIEPYSSGFDQEPLADIDVFFKVRAPGDSPRRVRRFPGVNRGLFASKAYLEKTGTPSSPDALLAHTCIGSGTWKLRQGETTSVPDVQFQVVTSDPDVHLQLALQDLGIVVMPLYMQTRPEAAGKLVHVLPKWSPSPILLCALFSGQSRLTPKVQVLLDFLGEYIGTSQDPRVYGAVPKNCFTDSQPETPQKPPPRRKVRGAA